MGVQDANRVGAQEENELEILKPILCWGANARIIVLYVQYMFTKMS
jgi:hypothetical protein